MAIVAVGSVLYLLEPVAVMGARSGPTTSSERTRSVASWSKLRCLVASDVHRVTMDAMFELFDNELLVTDNAFHHVANRNYTN